MSSETWNSAVGLGADGVFEKWPRKQREAERRGHGIQHWGCCHSRRRRQPTTAPAGLEKASPGSLPRGEDGASLHQLLPPFLQASFSQVIDALLGFASAQTAWLTRSSEKTGRQKRNQVAYMVWNRKLSAPTQAPRSWAASTAAAEVTGGPTGSPAKAPRTAHCWPCSYLFALFMSTKSLTTGSDGSLVSFLIVGRWMRLCSCAAAAEKAQSLNWQLSLAPSNAFSAWAGLGVHRGATDLHQDTGRSLVAVLSSKRGWEIKASWHQRAMSQWTPRVPDTLFSDPKMQQHFWFCLVIEVNHLLYQTESSLNLINDCYCFLLHCQVRPN